MSMSKENSSKLESTESVEQKDSSVTETKPTTSSETTSLNDNERKELEELRKENEDLKTFKAQVEAEKKSQAEAKKQAAKETVITSDTFLSKGEKVANMSSTEKEWEEMFKKGIPFKYE